MKHLQLYESFGSDFGKIDWPKVHRILVRNTEAVTKTKGEFPADHERVMKEKDVTDQRIGVLTRDQLEMLTKNGVVSVTDDDIPVLFDEDEHYSFENFMAVAKEAWDEELNPDHRNTEWG